MHPFPVNKRLGDLWLDPIFYRTSFYSVSVDVKKALTGAAAVEEQTKR